MTFSHKFTLLTVAAAVAASGSAHAAPGTESLVTLSMIEQYTAPATVLKDSNGRTVVPVVPAYENEWERYDFQGNLIQENYEYQSRIVTTRLSNREFLGFLVSEGVIPSIAGWSLRAVYNETNQIPTFYVTRAGSLPVYVGDYFGLETYGEASAVRAKSQTRYNVLGDVISSSSTDTSTTKSELFLTFSTRDTSAPVEEAGSTMNIQGMWTHTLALRPVRSGPNLSYRYIDGPGSIRGISGSINDSVSNGQGGFDYYESILEGSWSFPAARPVDDLSILYPEADAN